MYMMAMTLYPDTAEHALHQYPEVHCLPFEISKFEERNGHEIFTPVKQTELLPKGYDIGESRVAQEARRQDWSDAAR